MARLQLSFLGTFQVLLDESPVTNFRSSNNQGLLMYLAYNKEEPVSRELLALLFWPEESEVNARHNLRQALYRLRQILADQGEQDQPFLLVTRQFVQFNPNCDYQLDVNQFIQAIDNNQLDLAVAHYKGDLLAGFTAQSAQFENWLVQEREHLHNLALEAMSEAAADHLQAGCYKEAQTLARRQLNLEPWSESAYRQLMRAYALTGERVKALAQFDRCRQQLWDEIGVEPSAETIELYEEIKAGRLGKAESEESMRPPARVKHNLPADTTPFIGREQALADICQLLPQEDRRLVTILGPGGIGKTRLATAAGFASLEQFPDGVYFVDLSPVSDSAEIATAIAAALNYQAANKKQTLLPQLLQTLSRQCLLLILDNFEQVAGGPGVVNQLLQACPQLSLLITSRQRLNLASESAYRLAGLDFPDLLTVDDALNYTAVQLFLDSGRRARPGFELSEANIAYVLHICRLVQGMPLALILAAAWLELLSAADIAVEIEKGLDILSAEMADLPVRQRNIRAVFERSWQRLELEEQNVLARLSVFRGGFTREAAERVAGANLRILLSLVNQSILQRQPESSRFTLHELLRQYAAEHREQMAIGGIAKLAHCRYFARVVPGEVRQGLYFWPLHMPRQFVADRDNIQRAWRFALQHNLVRELSAMARGIVAFNFVQGVQPAPMIEQAIQSLLHGEISATSRELLHLKLIALSAREGVDPNKRVRSKILDIVPTLEAYGYSDICFWAYERLAHLFNGDQDAESLAWTQKAIHAANKIEDEVLANMALALDLWIRIDLGRHDGTTPTQLQELLAFFEPDFPTSHLVYGILWASGVYYAVIEEFRLAIRYAKRSKNIAHGWQDLLWISHSTTSLVKIYTRMNLACEAAEELVECLDWHLAIGQVWQTLGFLWGTVLFEDYIIDDRETAAMIVSMVYHHEEAVLHNIHAIDRNRYLLESQLGPDAFAAAWEKGKELDFDTAVALFRSSLTSAGV